MTYEPPQDFDEFLIAYEDDNNDWWRAPCGQHLNLFDEAVDRWRAAEKALAEKDEIISQLYEQIEILRSQ